MDSSMIKWFFSGLSGTLLGWVVATFKPTFPLIAVMVLFVLYDAYTAHLLDKRAHEKYPNATKRHEAKFMSVKFGKVITNTIPKRFMLILLAFLVERFVCIHWHLPLSYIVTGIICFEQAWSILENESSCRSDEDSRIWRLLQRIMIDKTSRHFDIDLSEIKKK